MNAHSASHFDTTGSTGSVAIDEVAVVIGVEAAFALALEFGGQGFYVSKDPTREPRIAATIGAEKAERFRAAFHGLTMTLPIREAQRREVVRLATTTQMTNREIAGTLRITERQVYRLLKAPESRGRGRRSDDRQLDMF